MNRDGYLPRPVSRRLPLPTPGAFLLWPVELSAAQWPWQEPLYFWALTEARAVVGPSLLELDLLAAWN
jgi:hypothetical protein